LHGENENENDDIFFKKNNYWPLSEGILFLLFVVIRVRYGCVYQYVGSVRALHIYSSRSECIVMLNKSDWMPSLRCLGG
jgi:hypothetical protein